MTVRRFKHSLRRVAISYEARRNASVGETVRRILGKNALQAFLL
jgi:hypothetical protein